MGLKRLRYLLAASLAIVSVQAPCLGATIGPIEYRDFTDSPFDLSRLGTDFFIEDFSDGVDGPYSNPFTDGLASPVRLKTRGAYGTRGTFSIQSAALWAYGFWDRVYGLEGIRFRFEFDESELGWLPQAVGFVTSNAGAVTLDFYGPNGGIVETLSAPAAPLPNNPDLTGLSDAIRTYQRPRFFGAIHMGGISRVDITAMMRSTIIDDFQYGRLIPEPAAWAHTALAVLIGFVRYRVRPQGRLRPFLAQRY